MLGQLSVLVDFDDNTLVGGISVFSGVNDGRDIDGSGSFDATLDDSTGTFSGSLEGAFVDPDDATAQDVFDANISGGFAGQSSAAIAGHGTGSILLDGDDDSLGFGVAFAAET